MNPRNTPPPLAGGGWGEGAAQPGTSMLTHARSMRQDATPAERRLWAGVRNRKCGGLKFRRQVPVGPFIADFYCASERLVVELDGVSHVDSDSDSERDAWMVAQGLHVLRFSNQDVLGNLEGVLISIQQAVARPPTPNPLPQGEGESYEQPVDDMHQALAPLPQEEGESSSSPTTHVR